MADHRGAGRDGRPAHASGGGVHRSHCPWPHLLPDGVRRRLVADEPARLARAVRLGPFSARRAGVPARRGHRAAVHGRLEGQGPARPGAARRVPRAPGRQVDRVPRSDQGAGAARLRRGRRLAAGPPAAGLHPGAHARRLPVRQRHVPARRPGAAGRDRRLGDGHRRRPQARPGLDAAKLARRHRRARGLVLQLRRPVRHAVPVRAAGSLRVRVRAAGRRHRLLPHPGQVEARRRPRAGLPAGGR
jgi:hypothetical protein